MKIEFYKDYILIRMGEVCLKASLDELDELETELLTRFGGVTVRMMMRIIHEHYEVK